ncbi:hypothetical protein NDU88_000744 [Pleurodeles waltl]|uniref:Uncharacterized protein n=1 Tax=Pleurodeles waltl TaxID=8319 RepID=A0AAV7P527_PLEWA|nr:hypothetical protein NDU88_000744 [Pleurodeles waltl]
MADKVATISSQQELIFPQSEVPQCTLAVWGTRRIYHFVQGIWTIFPQSEVPQCTLAVWGTRRIYHFVQGIWTVYKILVANLDISSK